MYIYIYIHIHVLSLLNHHYIYIYITISIISHYVWFNPDVCIYWVGHVSLGHRATGNQPSAVRLNPVAYSEMHGWL